MTTPFEIAAKYYGLKEVAGENNNPIIVDFFRSIGYEWVQDDETAWCAAFVNYCCKKARGKYTGKLNARSFMDFGTRTTRPELGDVCVLWRERPDSWKGHVGFYMNHDEEFVYLLGGNQDNQVCVKRYPIERVLGYRIVNRV